MKINLTYEEAEKVLAVNEEGEVHTFMNFSHGLVGCDHSISSIKKDLKNAHVIKKAGKQALEMGHGIVIVPSEKCTQSDLLFVETKEDYNKKEMENYLKVQKLKGGH